MKTLQIGIMGSASDLKYSIDALNFAKELGTIIGKSGNILVYGAEEEYSSLSTNAAIMASSVGGITVGIKGGKDKKIYGDFRPTVLIPSGLMVGGGREFTLVLSCDVIIAIGGGSGTLNEIAVAYQANIPIVVVNKFTGWAKRLSNKYLDERKRLKCVSVTSPEEAYLKAIKLVEERRNKNENNEC